LFLNFVGRLVVGMQDAMMEAMGIGSDSCGEYSNEEEDEDEQDAMMRLMSELQDKDGQLQMAAEIGSSLLEKNEKLSMKVDMLQEVLQQQGGESAANAEELRYRIAELERQLREHGVAAADRDAAAEARESELLAQAEELQSTMQALQSMVDEQADDKKALESLLLSGELHGSSGVQLNVEHELELLSPGGSRTRWESQTKLELGGRPAAGGVAATGVEETSAELVQLRAEVAMAREEQAVAVAAQGDAMLRERLRAEKLAAQQRRLLEEREGELEELHREAAGGATEIGRLEELLETERIEVAAARVQLTQAAANSARLSGELETLKRADGEVQLDSSMMDESIGLELQLLHDDHDEAQAQAAALRAQLAEAAAAAARGEAELAALRAEVERLAVPTPSAGDAAPPPPPLDLQLSPLASLGGAAAEAGAGVDTLGAPSVDREQAVLKRVLREKDRLAAENVALARELRAARGSLLISTASPSAAAARRRQLSAAASGSPGAGPSWPSARRVIAAAGEAAGEGTPALPSSAPPEVGGKGPLARARARTEGALDAMRTHGASAAAAAASKATEAVQVVSAEAKLVSAAVESGRAAEVGSAGKALWKKVSLAAHQTREAANDSGEPGGRTRLERLERAASMLAVDEDVVVMASRLHGLQAGIKAKQASWALASKDAQVAALKTLSVAGGTLDKAEAVAGQLAGGDGLAEDIAIDPMFQFFYLTAQSHKLNNPLLAEMKLTPQDLVSPSPSAPAAAVASPRAEAGRAGRSRSTGGRQSSSRSCSASGRAGCWAR
jgi:hypothetical protein